MEYNNTEEMFPEEILHFTFSRSGGKGGQNVNKVETKATLKIALSDLLLSTEEVVRLKKICGNKISKENVLEIVSQEDRTQLKNKKNCIEKLKFYVSEAKKVPKIRKKIKTPSPTVKDIEKETKRKTIKNLRKISKKDWEEF